MFARRTSLRVLRAVTLCAAFVWSSLPLHACQVLWLEAFAAEYASADAAADAQASDCGHTAPAARETLGHDCSDLKENFGDVRAVAVDASALAPVTPLLERVRVTHVADPPRVEPPPPRIVPLRLEKQSLQI
jgi:hypothetical protein